MCLIGVTNLKESGLGEGCFLGSKLIGAKKKYVKKIRQFSETHISQTAKPIFFKFGMQNHVHIRHKPVNCQLLSS